MGILDERFSPAAAQAFVRALAAVPEGEGVDPKAWEQPLATGEEGILLAASFRSGHIEKLKAGTLPDKLCFLGFSQVKELLGGLAARIQDAVYCRALVVFTEENQDLSVELPPDFPSFRRAFEAYLNREVGPGKKYPSMRNYSKRVFGSDMRGSVVKWLRGELSMTGESVHRCLRQLVGLGPPVVPNQSPARAPAPAGGTSEPLAELSKLALGAPAQRQLFHSLLSQLRLYANVEVARNVAEATREGDLLQMKELLELLAAAYGFEIDLKHPKLEGIELSPVSLAEVTGRKKKER